MMRSRSYFREMAGGVLSIFMQQASAQGARSTALSVLLVCLGTLLSSLAVAVYLHASLWILVFDAALVAINFVAFMFSYIFLLFRDRDALRSERFTLSKMALEKSLTGDTLSGFQVIERGFGSAQMLKSGSGTVEGEGE